ncbi:xanthine dehydrogenase family protein subunit M [Shinella sp. 838]|jgi:xanthine dehydrogenase YagS FAD-binding subunit|uniref:FAD binding domain-containing protein n=1 Tax=unclassified Shinella TaxID=2643062 RepID=UPI0003C52FAE|nr:MULTISPECIES: xanthine dehydrogenase family protein subunit M [unclassified Shinella]EYR80983.1 putative xanthine dehydrogenase (YagS-like), FAD binding subunit [Shinella sp. DD12]MCA0338416.1 xanthine dehydrogenase family protein subunit M [Pseudomonadota bacterium]MDG4675454.1 xanthine dehydrogenase family protein subunit M [Shinella sp. 838]
MNPFSYTRAETVADAVAALADRPQAHVLAGGTNLVDLMKYDVVRPEAIIDINRLPLREIEELADGGLRIGALASNSTVAYDARIETRYPLLASAILAGASPQLRNAATTAGNLLQRTRCPYFYDPSTPCNKREPGSGCAAIGGVTRMHAILGASDRCIAVHPSDMCVALAALGATVEVVGPDSARDIAFGDFHRLPGNAPHRDNILERGELVTAIRLEADHFARHYTYLKLRDRLSYAFALVSVAAAMEVADGHILDLRVALGGVAHKPWRDPLAEAEFAGAPAEKATFTRVADRLLAEAKGQGGNDFKIPLARRAIVRALRQAASGTPQSQTMKAIQ